MSKGAVAAAQDGDACVAPHSEHDAPPAWRSGFLAAAALCPRSHRAGRSITGKLRARRVEATQLKKIKTDQAVERSLDRSSFNRTKLETRSKLLSGRKYKSRSWKVVTRRRASQAQMKRVKTRVMMSRRRTA